MSFYGKIEESYYSFMDFLQEKIHLPANSWFVEPIESRGIPSLPVAVIILLAVIAGAYFLVAGFGAPGGGGGVITPAQAVLTVTIKNAAGTLLSGVSVALYDSTGAKVTSKRSGSDGTAAFPSLSIKTYTIKATFSGYKEFSGEVDLSKQKSFAIALETLSSATPTPTPSPKALGGGCTSNDECMPGYVCQSGKCVVEQKPANSATLTVTLKGAGVGVSGTALMFDANTNTQLSSIRVVGGTGVVTGLEAGQIVYFTAESVGFYAYDGSASKTTLKAGSNSVTITLTKVTQASGPTTCGNGKVDAGEECDTGDLTHCAQGATGCSESCACEYPSSVTNTTSPSCGSGNGAIAPGLQCQGSNVSLCDPKLVIGCKDCKCVYPGQTIITVKDVDGNLVAAATVKVFKTTSIATLTSKATDVNGQAKFDNLQPVFSYYATIEKTGFFTEYTDDFTAGATLDVVLTPVTADTTASLKVRVLDQIDGMPVPSTALSVLTTVRGNKVLLASGTTGGDGTKTFTGLRRGIAVTVTGANGPRAVESTDVALANAVNSVDAKLLVATASVTFYAYDIVTLEPVPDTTFTVSYPSYALAGRNAFSFASAGCLASSGFCGVDNLPANTLSHEEKLSVTAESPLYASSTQEFSLTANSGGASGANAASKRGLEFAGSPDNNGVVTFYLINWADVHDSELVFTGAKELSTGLDVTSLKQGGDYTLEFELYAANASTAVAHIGILDTEGVTITGHSPAAAFENGSTEAEDSKCTGMTDGLDYSSNAYKWVDLTYDTHGDNAFSTNVEVTVHIAPDAPINEVTHLGPVNIAYRSAIIRGNDLIRNPYDEALGVIAAKPLASGCDAKANEKTLFISMPQTTCSNGFCITYQFMQGDKNGFEGFNATSVATIFGQPVGDYLTMYYKIESFNNLATGGDANLALTVNPNEFNVLNEFSSVYGVDASSAYRTCKGAGDTEVQSTTSDQYIAGYPSYTAETSEGKLVHTTDFGDLTACSHYMNPTESGKPFDFSGYYVLDPKAPSLHSDISLKFEADVKTVECTKDADCAADKVCQNGACVNASANPAAARKLSFSPSVKLFGEVLTWVGITGNDVSTDGSLQLTFLQTNGVGDVGQPMWEANSIEGCLQCPPTLTTCSDDVKAFNASACGFGLVEINFKITPPAAGTFTLYLRTTPDFIKLKQFGAWYRIVNTATGAEVSRGGITNWFVEGFSQDITLAAGQAVEVNAAAYALKEGHTRVAAGYSSGGVDVANLKREVFVTKKATSVIIGYTDPSFDNCRGHVGLEFNNNLLPQDQFHLKDSCTNLVMRVSTVFPADGVITNVDTPGNVLVKAVSGDLDAAGCFESCPYTVVESTGGDNGAPTNAASDPVDYANCVPGFDALGSKGKWVLRYNTWADTCPARFKPTANLINGANLTLELKYVGSPYPIDLNVLVVGQENVPCTVKLTDNLTYDARTGLPDGSYTLGCFPRETCTISQTDPSNLDDNGNPITTETNKDSVTVTITAGQTDTDLKYSCGWKAAYQNCGPSNSTWLNNATFRANNCFGYLSEFTGVKSLYIAPFWTTYRLNASNSAVAYSRYPQLWVVDNKMQGPRDIYVYERGDNSDIENMKSEGLMDNIPPIHFDGPGTVVFAYTPRPGRMLVAYENRKVIFYNSNAPESLVDKNGPIKLLGGESEYTEAILGQGIYQPVEYPIQTEDGPVGPESPTAISQKLLLTNALYLQSVTEVLIGGAQRTANITAYWRSQGETKYCYCKQGKDITDANTQFKAQLEPKDCDALSFTDFTNPSICKGSIDEWRAINPNMSRVEHGCVVCNNTAWFQGKDCTANFTTQLGLGRIPCTYNPNVPTHDCDDRCLVANAGGASVGTSFLSICENATDLGYCGLHQSGVSYETECSGGYNARADQSTISPNDVSSCQRSGKCALLLDENGVPYCFYDGQNGDGLLTAADYDKNPELNVHPANLTAGNYTCGTDLDGNQEIIAVSDSCNVPCDIKTACVGSDECKIDCSEKGTYYTWENNATVQTGWLGPADWIPVGKDTTEIPIHPVVIQQTENPDLWHIPYAFFSANPQFIYPIPLVSAEKQGTFYKLNTIKEVHGCTAATGVPGYVEQGAYEIDVKNDIDAFKATGQEQWTGTANVMKLQKANYLGSKCEEKGFGTVALCAPIQTSAAIEKGHQFARCILPWGSQPMPNNGSITNPPEGQFYSLVSLADNFTFTTPQGYKITARSGLEDVENTTTAAQSVLSFSGGLSSSSVGLSLTPALVASVKSRIDFASKIKVKVFEVTNFDGSSSTVYKIPVHMTPAHNWWNIAFRAVVGAVALALIMATIPATGGLSIGLIIAGAAVGGFIGFMSGYCNGKNEGGLCGHGWDTWDTLLVSLIAWAALNMLTIMPGVSTLAELGSVFAYQPGLFWGVVSGAGLLGIASVLASVFPSKSVVQAASEDYLNLTKQLVMSGGLSYNVLPAQTGFKCSNYQGTEIPGVGVIGVCQNGDGWAYATAALAETPEDQGACRPDTVYEMNSNSPTNMTELGPDGIRGMFTNAKCVTPIQYSGSS